MNDYIADSIDMMQSARPADLAPSVTGGDPLDLAALDQLRELQTARTPNLLVQLIELFLADTPAVLRAMWFAVADGDAARLCQLAHKLKGSSASFGARVLAHRCEQLEVLGRSGTTNGAWQRLVDVEQEYARVSAALEQIREEALVFG